MKHLLFCCLTSILCLQYGFSQIAFQQEIVLDNSFGVVNPNAVVSADINGDGLTDVISTGWNEVAWFENLDNAGHFSRVNTIYLDDFGVFDVKVGDIDGDSDNDVFFYVNSSNGEQLVWVENTDGAGNFGAPQVLVVNDNTSPIGYQIIDVDGDGDLDISFGYRGFLGWIENDNLTFNVFTLLGSPNTSSSNYQGFTCIDVNGDNLQDFIVDGGYDLRAYNLQPDGSLGFLETMGTFAQGNFVTGADLDNDGDNDIIRIFENGGNDRKIRWYENTDGLGTFANAQTIVPLPNLQATSNQDSKSLRLADINGDNLLDIVFNESNKNTLSTYINQGNVTFSNEAVIADNFVNINSIFVEDLDGDNDLDILTTSREDCQVSWFQNTDGLGDYGMEHPISSYAYFINHVDAGDIDGDGDVDIVSSSHADSKLAWYENTSGYGDFDADQILISNTIPAPRDVFVVDVNGDSFNDILFFSYFDSNPDEYKIRWLENDGNGNFIQDHEVDNVSDMLIRIQHADIDNDGDVDIISAENDSVLKLYKNNGDGTFAASVTFSQTGFSYPLSLQVGDVDSDNDIDVLVSYNNNEIIWHENDGSGDLSLKNVITPQMHYPSSIFLADINGDSFNDLIFANKFQGEIGYFLNTDGQGNFGPKTIASAVPDKPSAVYAVDVDNDGDMDIVTNSESGSKLMWFENDDSGNFGNPIEITINTERVNHITSADFNFDGKPDLMTSSYDDDQIALYENLGFFSNRLNGIVKLDANSNGCDGQDSGIANLLITTTNSSNSFATFTQSDGSYTFLANQDVFTTEIASSLPIYYSSNPLNHIDDFSTSTATTLNADFCVEASQSINNMEVVIYPNLNDPRPGFDTSYQLVFKNNGTTVLNGNVTFAYDNSKIQFLNASETIASQTTNALTFNYSNLNPFESRTIDLEFNVFPPPTTNIDDVLVSTATITPLSGDDNPSDNTFDLSQIVIGSYDPNDIQILEGAQIHINDADQFLHFLIRFQNTGTASAINVRVEHILDSKLNWTTLQLLSLSHDGRVEITDGSNIQFIFDNINLPDQASDEEGSIGYIAFKIKPLDNIITGDTISGVADIYFDFNPPIITNTATTEYVDNLSIADINADTISFYPNPTSEFLHINSTAIIHKIEVFDILGKKRMTLELANRTLKVDMSELEHGVYFFKISSENSVETKKLLKN